MLLDTSEGPQTEGPQTLDIDIDEIRDRIDLLKETVDQISVQ